MRPSELRGRKFSEPCPACRGEVALLSRCEACSGTGVARARCRTCFTWRPSSEFLSAGRLVRRCADCRHRAPDARGPVGRDGPLLVKWNPCSKNRKTGPIPVSMTSPRTCPPGCPWLGRGCYGEQYFAGVHWRRLDGGRGISWKDFCARVAALPAGQLWRHNEAGDLPGDGDEISEHLLVELALAARGTRGFTYTHKPVLGDGDVASVNRWKLGELRTCSEGGLVVNLSADGLDHADQLGGLGLGPVVVVLPAGSSRVLATPAGRRVVTCPALHDEEASCASCRLCARGDRGLVVGFPAHGFLRRRMSERLVQLRLF